MTGGGPALGAAEVAIEAGRSSMGCVGLSDEATPAFGEEAGGNGVETIETGAFIGGMITAVVGLTRGGGTTMLDFFLGPSRSTAVSARAVVASEAGATVVGRGGNGGAGSSFLVAGVGITAVLLT